MSDTIDIEFSALCEALAAPAYKPIGGGPRRLMLAAGPTPFVAPKLQQLGAVNLSVEVLFIQAPAAVGKTTMARHLSAARSMPLLNLADVPVGTGSLQSLISNLVGPGGAPLNAFHSGALPIIIDALDEGRLLSGEASFESFLSSTADLLLSDRTVTNRPKLIIFGRSDSTDLAKIGLELEGDGDITSSLLDVGWFGEIEARQLIDECAKVECAKAEAAGRPAAAYLRHPAPAADAITAYFGAIEGALGLSPGQLWIDERGRAFAGYAPVLAAVGGLLADIENLSQVATQLRTAGIQQAWGVIERVLQEILDRERGKLCDKLEPQLSVPLPPETYDRSEQLTFLTYYVHGRPPQHTGRIVLPPADQAKYDAMARQYLADHPFVRQGGFRDSVLGAMVLAFAVTRDLLRNTDLQKLVEASRQPFLWRSIRSQLGDLTDGRYIGCILSSFWSDPLTKQPQVVIRSPDGDLATVRIPSYCESEVIFDATLPIHFEGLAKDCDVDVSGTIRLQGHALQNAAPAFHVHGTTTILCDTIEVAADTLAVHGQFWLEPENAQVPSRLTIIPKNGTRVGWGLQIRNAYPWTQIPSTLPAPYTVPQGDRLVLLIDECAQRFRSARPLTLHANCAIPENDPHTRWAERSFPAEFPALMRALVQRGIARTEQKPASGSSPKFIVHLNQPWSELQRAFRSNAPDDRALVANLRAAVQ